MLEELEYTLDDTTYLIKKLPLGKSQEVLVRILKLIGGADGIEENLLASLPQRLRVDDINFLRERLLGEHCAVMNDAGAYVPLGKALVERHFAGHIGKLFHILGKCIVHNFADFLADLRLDELVDTGKSVAE